MTRGSCLKMLRSREGLSIRQAAAGAGISHGHLSELENDKSKIGLDVAIALMEFYGGSLKLFARLDGPSGKYAPRDIAPRDTESR